MNDAAPASNGVAVMMDVNSKIKTLCMIVVSPLGVDGQEWAAYGHADLLVGG